MFPKCPEHDLGQFPATARRQPYFKTKLSEGFVPKFGPRPRTQRPNGPGTPKIGFLVSVSPKSDPRARGAGAGGGRSGPGWARLGPGPPRARAPGPGLRAPGSGPGPQTRPGLNQMYSFERIKILVIRRQTVAPISSPRDSRLLRPSCI